jgi:surface polysaccharide O-acyltransferase-like enzyme
MDAEEKERLSVLRRLTEEMMETLSGTPGGGPAPARPERNVQLDAARTVATLVVIMIHLNDRIFDPVAAHASDAEWLLHAALNALGRLAVPVFVMISGALLIPRIDVARPFAFYKKRIPQFVFLLLFYALLTDWVAAAAGYTPAFDAWRIVSDLAGGRMQNAFHLWFLKMIIGLYLAAPFIGAMQRGAPSSTLRTYCLVAAAVTMLPSTVAALTDSRPWRPFGNEAFGSYVVYFVAGHLIVNCNAAARIATRHLLAIGLGCACVAIAAQWWYRGHGEAFRSQITDYGSLLTAVPALSAFAVLLRQRIEAPALRRACHVFGQASFGVYLIHLAFLHVVLHLLQTHLNARYALMPLAFPLIVAPSLLYSRTLARVPLLRKLVV